MESLNGVATSLILVGLVVAGVVAISVSRRGNGQPHRSGEALWSELRKAHKLSLPESWTLRRAAEKAGLDPTSLIFIEPHVLQQAIDAAGRDSASGKQLERLAEQLYG